MKRAALLPIDVELLRRAGYERTAKPERPRRIPLEEQLRRHRRKRIKIVRARRRKAFRERWMQ